MSLYKVHLSRFQELKDPQKPSPHPRMEFPLSTSSGKQNTWEKLSLSTLGSTQRHAHKHGGAAPDTQQVFGNTRSLFFSWEMCLLEHLVGAAAQEGEREAPETADESSQ